MLRPLLILILLPSLAPAAPPPKGADKKAEPYFLTKSGAKWVLERKAGDTTTEGTMTVTAVDEKDGVFRVTTEEDWPNARPVRVVTHEVSAKGVSVLARGGRDLPTPEPLIKLPAKNGDIWKHPTQLGWSGSSYTVGEAAEVETPAGSFKAIRVESVGTGHDSTTVRTAWWSPGVGVVKSTLKIDDREHNTTVLKSFTPGK